MHSTLRTQLIHLLETATKHEYKLHAVEYSTHTYLYVSKSLNELALEVMWDDLLASALPWQPLRLYGVAAHQFWQVLQSVGHERFNYGVNLTPVNMQDCDRLTAAGRFRQQRGLAVHGRWAAVAGYKLQEIQRKLIQHPSGSHIFSPSLTGISLPELGELGCQLAWWQNDGLEAELFTATQWIQQEDAKFLTPSAARAALGGFTWRDGITVEQLCDAHVRPRQLKAVLALLSTNPTEPVLLQVVFHDARLPDTSATPARRQADTEAFCQAFGYETLVCRAEYRAWFTNNGQQLPDKSKATGWLVNAWQLSTAQPMSTEHL
jgi:hypothetical protein